MRKRQMAPRFLGKYGPRSVWAAVFLFVLAGQVPGTGGAPCWAFTLYEGRALTARLDTTITYGLMWRVASRDKDQIGGGNGGNGANPNWDDGDLNYDKGLVSNLLKVTSELEVRGERLGAFVRGTGFYDFETMHGDRERYDLGDGAEEQVGRDADLLDAYLWASADLGPLPLQLRVGEQVVNWGESTFILGGIGLNTVNPIDVAKLRAPGAELREALLPEGMVFGSVGLTANLSVEGLYLYDWEGTQLDEAGTYFSTVDYVGDDGKKVIAANLGDAEDASAADTLFALPRGRDVEADDQGQFGLALRYFASWLHDTELSFYYLRYHNKLPTVDGKTGTLQGTQDAVAAAGQVYTDAGVAPGADAGLDALAQAAATDAYLKTARYRTAWEDEINLFGVGFNTELFGWGVQGELSHRQDVPLQIDDTEILFAVLSPMDPSGGLGAFNQLGDYSSQLDSWIRGSTKKDLTQVQLTLSKLLAPVLGAQGGVFLGEVGWLHVHDMPRKNDLRLETFGPFGTGNSVLGPATGNPVEGSGVFPDADSWGYVLLGQLDYSNVIGPVGLSPRVAWSHDVRGISPVGGPFIEGRKAITFGVEGRYLDAWSADVNYTNFFGGGRPNQINDRDYVGCNIKYRF